MSGIAGIYHRDGRPAEVRELARLSAALAERGSDGGGEWIEGAAGLAHRMLATTPESLSERQPLRDETGALCLVLDGRVDNREELRAALESRGVRLRDRTDAEHVLKAYECWGEAAPERILGDFAFAIWDAPRRRLFCARDPLGIRPFCYHLAAGVFVFGSEPRQVLAYEKIAREANEGMAAEYLSGAMNSSEETLFRGILRLPPGHSLTIEADRATRRRYFDIDPAREIRYRDDSGYAEHLLDVLNEAVRCRLRARGPAGVALSGGLDSSSVAALAQRMGAPGFAAFSIVFPGRSCDESPFIESVLAKCGIAGRGFAPSEMPAAFYREQARRYADFPDYPNGAMARGLTAAAREQGCRVLLTGLGGDEWLMGSFYHYADLLRRFRPREFFARVRGNRALSGPRFSWRTVLRFGFWPLMPGAVRRSLDGSLARHRIPDWIDPGFARRAQLIARLREQPPAPDFGSLARQDIHGVLTSGWRIHALEMENRAASDAGVEHRHPFSDRRVLEFALALPEEQRWRGEETKFVLREAMRDALPEEVRARRSKAEFSPLFTSTFANGGGELLFDSMAIASLPWVNEIRVKAKYREMAAMLERGDPAYTRHACPLWMIFGVDAWHSAAFGDRVFAGDDHLMKTAKKTA